VTAEAMTVREVRAGYGGSQVLHGISLSVHEGETLLVVGPNGHGKSTLAAVMSGMLAKASGSVTLHGRPIDNLSPRQRVRAGLVYVPQGDLLFPSMSIVDTLFAASAYRRAVWRERHARLEKVFELFPSLRNRAHALANSLSGGERRMLAIGRALMASWSVLIIDEPSLGLAPVVVEDIYAKIRDIRSAGQSIILIDESITHAEIADRVLVVREGRISAEYDAAALRESDALAGDYFVGR
jgi:branched-chain amino acid transport system ATP-binding protein